MSADPIRAVYALRRRRRGQAEGWSRRLGTLLFGLAVVGVSLPLVRRWFLSFLDGDPAGWSAGLQGVWLRAGLAAMVVVALAVHASVLRGAARDTLSILPVSPSSVVWAELGQVARTRGPWVLAIALSLAPIGVTLGPTAFAVGTLLIVLAAAMAWTGSAVAFLGAVEVAESPAWAPVLDALRGNNPRPQAALIYALVPGTLGGGVLLAWAASGATVLLEGDPAGAVPLVLMAGVAVGLGALVPSRAERSWYRASMVLADISARYAVVEGPEEASRVYLDWTVRWLPERVGRWALLELRHGWRARRSWLSASWLVALAAFVVGWTVDPTGPARALAVGGTTPWLVGWVVVCRARDTPALLATWLDDDPSVLRIARLWAVVWWSQGTAWLAGGSVALRAGAGAGATVFALITAGAVLAGALAGEAARHPRRGPGGYMALAWLAPWVLAWGVWRMWT